MLDLLKKRRDALIQELEQARMVVITRTNELQELHGRAIMLNGAVAVLNDVIRQTEFPSPSTSTVAESIKTSDEN